MEYLCLDLSLVRVNVSLFEQGEWIKYVNFQLKLCDKLCVKLGSLKENKYVKRRRKKLKQILKWLKNTTVINIKE